jgi:HK97 family phage major capsid protein
MRWTREEHEAFQRVEEVRSMSTVDTQGGYLSPLVIDPTILITSAGSINNLRAISRVVQTVSDTWNGVTSAGVTAEWLAEGVEAADAGPTVARPRSRCTSGARSSRSATKSRRMAWVSQPKLASCWSMA